MQTSPPIKEIKRWLAKENPLNLFESDFSIKDIDPKAWSGHFNLQYARRIKAWAWRTRGIKDIRLSLNPAEEKFTTSSR